MHIKKKMNVLRISARHCCHIRIDRFRWIAFFIGFGFNKITSNSNNRGQILTGLRFVGACSRHRWLLVTEIDKAAYSAAPNCGGRI
jgi:hypothetical protein